MRGLCNFLKISGATYYLSVVDEPAQLRGGVGLPRGAVEIYLIPHQVVGSLSRDLRAVCGQDWKKKLT